MLSNLFAKLQEELENYNLNLTSDQMEILEELFDYFKGGTIPMKVIRKKTGLDYKQVHNLMTILVTKKMLKPKYKILCDKDSITGASRTYDSISEIPTKICDRCDELCVILENVSVEFEVI